MPPSATAIALSIPEILGEVLCYLSVSDILCRARLVSPFWRSVVDTDPNLLLETWRKPVSRPFDPLFASRVSSYWANADLGIIPSRGKFSPPTPMNEDVTSGTLVQKCPFKKIYINTRPEPMSFHYLSNPRDTSPIDLDGPLSKVFLTNPVHHQLQVVFNCQGEVSRNCPGGVTLGDVLKVVSGMKGSGGLRDKWNAQRIWSLLFTECFDRSGERMIVVSVTSSGINL